MFARIANMPVRKTSQGCIIRGWVLLAVMLFFALPASAPFLYGQPHRQTSKSPEDRVTTFYKWVIGRMIRNRSPVREKKVISTYLSKSLYRWLYASADAEMRRTYLLPGNDWSESWIDEIKIVAKKKTVNRTMIRVDLGEKEPPDHFVDTMVNLVREGGTWKIDCIQSADEEIGSIPEFDPKLDPPGCKPV